MPKPEAPLVLACVAALGLCPAGPASAQDAADWNRFYEMRGDNQPNWCRNGQFPSIAKDYVLATLDRDSPLLNDSAGSTPDACPDADSAICPAGDSLAAGAMVVVAKSYRGFQCVLEPKTSNSGWIPESALSLLPVVAPASPDWTGSWTDGTNSIEIAEAAGGAVTVSGQAFWYGINDVVHTGSLDFAATPTGNRLTFLASAEYECGAELIQLGRFLVVRDNSRCGGLNVRFNGVYWRDGDDS